MKTPPKRILLSSALACSVLALTLEVSPAGPQPPLSSQAPDVSFTEDVVIDTGSSPALQLNQNTSLGNTAQRWDIFGNAFNFVIKDVNTNASIFAIRPAAPADSLNISNNGNVGIGVPFSNNVIAQQALHVVRGDTPSLRLEQDTSGSFPAQTWDIRGNELNFFITNVTGGGSPFTIDPAGNIGLGTFTPAGKLHVLSAGNQLSIFQSSDDNAVQFRLQTNSINRRFVALNTAGQQQSQLLFGDNGAFDFLGPTASDVRMRFLANGNVGIGTTAPTQKLSVNGTAGKPGGGSWSTFSDERLKDIKGEFKAGLDEVMKLQPIRYEYKADNAEGIVSEGEHVGFGAEAVSKVIPEAVTRNSDGYLMIDNDPILWTMLNAIKEQNAQNAELKTEIATQGAQVKVQNEVIAQLKEQLERLQAQVVLQAGNPTVWRMRGATNVNR